MDCRLVRYGERENLSELHPELFEKRPDLCDPAFPANPVPYDDDFPYLFYFVEDGEILGARRAMPDVVCRGDEVRDFAWCFDTIVNPAHHGRGIGTKLVAVQVEEFARREQLSGAAFSAPAMMRIYEKLDYEVLGFTPKYALIRNVGPFIHRKVSLPFVTGASAFLVNVALALRTGLKGGRAASQANCREVDAEEFRALASDIERDETRWHWDKEADWATSRLQSVDTMHAVRDAENRLLGVFVLREREPDAEDGPVPVRRLTMMHYVVADRTEAREALVAALADLLYERRADVADIVVSDPALIDALERAAFIKRGPGMTFVFKQVEGKELSHAASLSDWHLTHFCSDGYSFA